MIEAMTPKERRQALLSGQELDRLPIEFTHNSIVSKLNGQNYLQGQASADSIADQEIALYQRYCYDHLNVDYGLNGLGRALGSRLLDFPDSAPAVDHYACASIDEVLELSFSNAEITKDPNLFKLYQACHKMVKVLGPGAIVQFEIPGPLTALTSLMEAEYVLRALRRQPDQIHQALRIITDLFKKMIEPFAELGVYFWISDPVASTSLISPKQFKIFCQPYLTDLVAHMHACQSSVILHICGNTVKILDDIISIGVDIFSLDEIVDLSLAKDHLGHSVCLLGNVAPVKTIYQGTPSDIREEVDDCFTKAWDSSKGFIIGPGCGIPYATSEKNIEVYLSACLAGATSYAKKRNRILNEIK